MNIQVFTGSANRRLALSVVKVLDVLLGRAMVERFPDGGCAYAWARALGVMISTWYGPAHRQSMIT